MVWEDLDVVECFTRDLKILKNGLENLKTVERVAELRGKTVEEILG